MARKKNTDDIPTPPFGAEVAPLLGAEQLATVLATGFLPCPTCGTAKTANRCDVCGHQDADT